VLRLFRKPLSLLTVVDDLVTMLDRMLETVHNLASGADVDTPEAYSFEAAAFVYILGWYGVQVSGISRADKQRLSAELTGAVAKRLNPDDPSKQIALVSLLQERVNAYRHALENGKGRDWAAKLVYRFLEYVAVDGPENVPLQAALYSATPRNVSAVGDFLTGLSRDYKFV
jgi:hypothetical protein